MIFGVAIRTKEGKIYQRPAPARHYSLMLDMMADKQSSEGSEQGFVVFMTRAEALEWAQKQRQLLPGKDITKQRHLYSEDMW